MVLDFYNLKEQPFGVTPEPRYLYPSPTHREALASLAYGIQSGRGFMAMIATPGMGKTTILYQLLQHLESSARVAFLCQTLRQPDDMMRGIVRDLGVPAVSTDIVEMESQLHDVLLTEAKRGRKVVVVIDEAQNLDDSALEAVRLLSNFESSSDKLMQIILAGQLQLGEKLASPRLVQLRQRMSIIARLERFNADETRHYIAHRLRVAGYDSTAPLFTPDTEALIAKYSEGIPRNINNICFNALSLGCVLKQRTIGKSVIREVMRDLDLGTAVSSRVTARNPISHVRNFAGLVRQSFGLRAKMAVSAALLIVLLLAGVRRGTVTLQPPSLPAVSASSPSQERQSAGLPELSSSAGVNSIVASTPIQTAEKPEKLQSLRAPKPRSLHEQQLTSNPNQLWAKVRKQNSNAEVELARMYLQGSGVPQNCQQAEVLLLAASRKGNPVAAELLSQSDSGCANVSAGKGEQQ